jgi:hypothetical protein
MADDYDLMKYDNRQSSIINHQTSARRPGEIKLEKFLDRSGLPYFRHNLGAISIIETETETMANMETRLAARIAELLEDYCGMEDYCGIPIPQIFTEASKIDPHWVEMRRADKMNDWYIVIAFSDGSQYWMLEE